MKLLREYIGEALRQEILVEKKGEIKSIDDVKTVGDLKAVIRHAQRKKVGKVGGKGLADTALDIVVDEIQGMIPGFATVKNLTMAMKGVYDLDDKAKVGELSALNVDDDVSKVIDDAVENAFLKDYVSNLEKFPEETELEDIDITKALRNWMSKKFNKTTVSKELGE